MLARSGDVDICVSWVIVACMAKQCEGIMSAETKAQTQSTCCKTYTGPYVDKYGILPRQEIMFVRAMCGGATKGLCIRRMKGMHSWHTKGRAKGADSLQ